jgi:hypothetical protein
MLISHLASLFLILKRRFWHCSHHVVVDKVRIRLYGMPNWELLVPSFVGIQLLVIDIAHVLLCKFHD